jgi:hypothetical protein
MRPYYEEAGITIYHGDAREIGCAVSSTPCGEGVVCTNCKNEAHSSRGEEN